MEFITIDGFNTLVDETHYLNAYPEVQSAINSGQFTSGLEHFLLVGAGSGLQPVAGFDAAYILSEEVDWAVGFDRAEMIRALDGDDVVLGLAGNDQINGNTANDQINGNTGNDTLYGGQGDDTIWGGQDNDLLFGDKGNDTLIGDKGNDTIWGGEGSNQLFGSTGNDQLNGGESIDTLNGGDGDDTLNGGDGDDTLFGEAGTDILSGSTGNDYLDPGTGPDTLYGGEGADTFAIAPGTGGGNSSEANWLPDFISGQDLILLNGGLTFEDLSIFGETANNTTNTIIQDQTTGEYLAVIPGILPIAIDGNDFLPPPQPSPVLVDNTPGPITAYFVSTTGNDANSGTIFQPFRTIQKAAELAQPGQTIYIRGGTYREGNIRPTNNGTANAPITFTAYNDEDVIISGADPITNWTQHNQNIYKAPMTRDLGLGNNQIFADGQMMVEARWPNIPGDPTAITYTDNALSDTGRLNNPNAPSNSRVSGTYTDADLTQPAGFWDGAKINFTPGNNWFPQTGTVTSSAPGELDFQFTWRGTAGHTPNEQDAYYLWGTLNALDAPTEWYYDADTSQVYLWAPNGQNPSDLQIEAKRRTTAFDLSEKSYITIEGIEIFGSNIKTAGQTSNITLDNIEVLYGAHTQDLPYPLQGSGTPSILLDGSNNLLKDSYIAYSSGSGVRVLGSGSKVENSVIHNTAYTGLNDSAIRASGQNTEILNNTGFNNGMAKVIDLFEINQGQVSNNEIYNGGLQTSDGGGIFAFDTDGNGTVVADNAIHNMLSPQDNSLNHFGMSGIYLDRAYNFDVHHNIMWATTDGGIKLQPRNASINDPDIRTRIFNNTTDDHFWFRPTGGTFAGTMFKNNIFARLDDGISPRSDTIFEDNLLLSQTDPNFVNAANNNYRLAATSPAIDAGQVLEPFTDGFTGDAPDIGAFEVDVERAVPGAMILESQLSQLEFQFDAPQNGTVSGKVVGLPVGRKLPADFQLIIGDSTPSGKFTSSYFDPATNLSTVVFTDVAVPDETGSLPISVQIGANAPILITQTLDIEPPPAP
ncbi:MAG: hypothetical protein Fur0025_39710 [Oscillatoriaceae cyanobacterium]